MEDYNIKARELIFPIPDENEVRASFLKARERMARRKPTEAESKDNGTQEVRKATVDGLSCSKRRDPWMVPLSETIAENYCCKAFRHHEPGKQTQLIGFVGLEGDVKTCTAVFRYMVLHMHMKCGQIRQKHPGHDAESVRRLCDSFGYGFVQGLQDAFREQTGQQENGQELTLVTPAEVEEAAKSLEAGKFEARKDVDSKAHHAGRKEGQDFFKPVSKT